MAVSYDRDATGEAIVLAVDGRIDNAAAKEFETQMLDSAGGPARGLVLDLARTSFISSAGLRALLIASRRLGAQQRRVVLCAVPDAVRDILEISGFATLFPIYPSREQALAAVR